ncbi:MAG TPA: DoxX family protein [Polyangiaceae bacterium]|nr:DoxX family protein [Polyangiaceae bacterium]
MESTLRKPVDVSSPFSSKTVRTLYWITTAVFCLQIGFTAYAQLNLPQVAAAFTHLGFPSYFRVELSWAKFLGLAVLVAPAPPRLKEWAYAGFAMDLASAVLAHVAVGDGPQAWGWAAGTLLLWAASYFLWRRVDESRKGQPHSSNRSADVAP